MVQACVYLLEPGFGEWLGGDIKGILDADSVVSWVILNRGMNVHFVISHWTVHFCVLLCDIFAIKKFFKNTSSKKGKKRNHIREIQVLCIFLLHFREGTSGISATVYSCVMHVLDQRKYSVKFKFMCVYSFLSPLTKKYNASS